MNNTIEVYTTGDPRPPHTYSGEKEIHPDRESDKGVDETAKEE